MGAVILALLIAMVAARWSGVLSPVAFDLVFAAVVALSLCASLRQFRARPLVIIGVGLAVPALAVAAMLRDQQIRLSPYLAIMIVNALVAYGFSRSLSGERPGLIRQIIRLTESGPDDDPGWRRYALWQSWAWTLFGAATSSTAALAMVSPALRPGLSIALSLGAAFQLLWFVLSHVYAQRRYDRPESWRDTMRYMARRSIWRELDL